MSSYSEEISRTSILTSIVNSITNERDTVTIFQLAVQKIKHYVACDQIAIIYYNPNSKNLYLTPALNVGLELNETTVACRDTILNKVIQTKTEWNCPDLTETSVLKAEDELFFSDNTISFLAVPILHASEVLGILLLTSSQKNAFDEKDQALVEEIALLLTLALQNAQLEREFEQGRANQQRWHGLYKNLFNSSQDAIAVINYEDDLIYETNAAFEHLTDYSSDQLHGMRYSDIHPNSLPINLQNQISSKGHIKLNNIELLKKGGQRIVTNLDLITLDVDQRSTALAIYRTKSNQSSQAETWSDLMQLINILEIGQQINPRDKFEQTFTQLLLMIAEIQGAKYIAVHLYQEENDQLLLFHAHKIIPDQTASYNHPFSIALDDGLYRKVLTNKTPLIINDVFRQANFAEMRPIAKKLSYTSFLAFPMIALNRPFGVLSLFYENEREWAQHEIRVLGVICTYLAQLIENYKLHQPSRDEAQQLAFVKKIAYSINSSLELDKVIRLIILEIKRIINFDQASITLFNESGENLQVFKIIDELYAKNLQAGIWLPFNAGGLGWLKSRSETEHNKEAFKQELELIERKMKSKLNALLFSSGRYLGTISLAGIKENLYTQTHKELLEQIASSIASAIENARLFEDLNKQITEFSALADGSKSISSNLELENFVYTVSHDLKSPIVSIQGFASILLNDYGSKLGKKASHYLERIIVNANKMEKLIRDLLELSRIGSVVNAFEEVDAFQIITDAENELIYQIQEKKIKLNISRNLPKIYCDRNRLTQVFTNLLSNAIKYIGDDNPAPQIEIQYEAKANYDQFCVKDNGIGIEKKYHRQIFGLFQVLDQAEEKLDTGVGLTIAKRIIENHHGKIWLKSKIGEGSSFYFTIAKKEK